MLVCSWGSVLLNAEQMLFVSMNEDYIDSLTVEKLSEVNLDGFTEIEHGAHFNDLVQCLEHDVFCYNFCLNSRL